MPNHYTVAILCYAKFDEEAEDRVLTAESFNAKYAEVNFCEIVHPVPAEIAARPNEVWPLPAEDVEVEAALRAKYGYGNAFQWQSGEWGTKWGAYRTHAIELGGDCSPMLISFECAWGPPKPEILSKIVKWLENEVGIESPLVVGMDPYDCTTRVLVKE